VLDTISKVAEEKEFEFLKSNTFALWTWTISAARGGERKEHLIISTAYGKIRNNTLETMMKKPTGLILPEEVLTYLRSSFSFIRDKPPVQYTIIKLIHNVLSQFQDPSRGRGEVYKITTDMIYDKAKILFPSWRDFDTQTIQIKRRWINEALKAMWVLKMIGKPIGEPDSWLVPIPTLRTRGPIHLALCKKLSQHQLKITKKHARRGRPRIKPLRLKAHPKTKKLDDYA